ncbi:histone-lysine N-methyltransferase SETMAR [Nephila pilipes]|uniref:Histone-lysine N-methyltransferase SETMAR n=1 Tax=Nephila pilipes TaxID=299642 RepID=A0A8X6NRV6_NEPPI|nr:histone-lysine N-methyltransferase SETMAR [Nephila pilipes]
MEIKDELEHGDSEPLFTAMKFSAAEFKRDRASLGDDERSRRPKIATTSYNFAEVHQMVLDDSRIKVREIAEAMSMSEGRFCHVLNQNISMKTQSGCWIPCLLMLAPKRVRLNISNALLVQFRSNKSEFGYRLITVDVP